MHKFKNFSIARFEPMYFLIPSPVGHLALRIMPTRTLQFYFQFRTRDIALKKSRKGAIFETEFVHAFI